MSMKRLLRPTNRRIRLCEGLLLAALFCIQCTSPDASIGGAPVGEIYRSGAADTRLEELERLARTDHAALLKMALAHYDANIRDYTCKFSKQERLRGRLGGRQEIQVKFLDSPFSVVMQWLTNAPMGDRMIYVKGKYNGNMIVKPKGALIVFTGGRSVMRNPEGKDVMANTLRPVTMFGFRQSLTNLLKVYELAETRNDNTIRFVGYCPVGGRKTIVLERVLPAKEDYPAKTTTLYLDVEHLIPLGLEGTDWDDQLSCSYYYEDVKLNVGLTEEDFTPEANGMKIKK